MKVIGVDFSGAKQDRNTWVAQGEIHSDILTLTKCCPMPRKQLTRLLDNCKEPAIAAMDFPFSVPRCFARFWQPEATEMPDLWEAAGSIEIEYFRCVRDRFVSRHGEPKRCGDHLYTGSFSPLHDTNPNMVPMTFRGMQMLHQLWPDWMVPPLPFAATGQPADSGPLSGKTLLEVMPGAALRALNLPYRGFNPNPPKVWRYSSGMGDEGQGEAMVRARFRVNGAGVCLQPPRGDLATVWGRWARRDGGERPQQEGLADQGGASLRGVRLAGWRVSCRRAPSGWEWNRSQPCQGASELGFPRPALGQMQGKAAC